MVSHFWQRFWHEPVRAERLALTRILFAAALLTDQLFQYLPHLADFYGPAGIARTGLLDDWSMRTWRWTMLVFNTDDMNVVVPLFWIWVAATCFFLVGCQTRWASILVWFLALCFHYRNTALLNFGDNLLRVALFLLMVSPCGRAWSVDAWLGRRRQAFPEPAMIPAWPVRLFQIQLCMIYFTTGLAKLVGVSGWLASLQAGELPKGSWWDGTSMHNVMNMISRTRWSYAQLPVPMWMSMPLTYMVVAWEVLFPLLVIIRPLRKWALGFGILLHLGILLTLEIGWFSFYSIAMYGVWLPIGNPATSPQPTPKPSMPKIKIDR